MDLKQLDAVVAIADHGSFSAAARALHTVQSNVSAHIARLEAELGVEVVDRRTGDLTEEGDAVVARARRIQREMEAVTSDVAALHDEVVGSVRFGVIGTIGRWLVPRMLESLASEHPRISVVVVDATTTSLLPQLVRGSLDVAVVNLPVVDPMVSTSPLFDETRIVVAPNDHPLAEYESIELRDLAEHDLVLEPSGTAFRDELDRAASAAGTTLRTMAEVDGMRLVASLAFEGFGPAILPTTAAPPWLQGDWKRIPLHGVSARSVGVAQRRHERVIAPTRALIQVLLEALRETAGTQAGVTLRFDD
ncbi:MAG TPA: LysR family transcriptional regulator [Acidimicrobiales bacterium]|nr:LysR family transcriptional regulator [Acidimicrobiales bacterium]